MSGRLFNFVRRSKVLVLVAVLVLFTGVGTLIAQNPNSTAGMLDRILGIVSLSQVNYRFTPTIRSSDSQITCSVLNVSANSHVVSIFMRDGRNGGGILVATQNLPLASGVAFTPPIANLSVDRSPYCQFIVVDGTRSDIRGAMDRYDLSSKLVETIPAE